MNLHGPERPHCCAVSANLGQIISSVALMLDDYRGEADFCYACTINGNPFDEKKKCSTKALGLKKAANATNIRGVSFSRMKWVISCVWCSDEGCMLQPDLLSDVAPFSQYLPQPLCPQQRQLKARNMRMHAAGAAPAAAMAGEKAGETGRGMLPNPNRILMHQSYSRTHTSIQIIEQT